MCSSRPNTQRAPAARSHLRGIAADSPAGLRSLGHHASIPVALVDVLTANYTLDVTGDFSESVAESVAKVLLG
jgi:hypothetical protein